MREWVLVSRQEKRDKDIVSLVIISIVVSEMTKKITALVIHNSFGR